MEKLKNLFITDYSLDNIDRIAELLLENKVMEYPCVTLIGNLGAGKTTLVQAIIRMLGFPDLVSSPTFSIVQEYGPVHEPIYHLDLYRLQSLEEALEIGIEEYLTQGKCFIEWPQIIESILPEQYCRVELENLGNFERQIRLVEINNPFYD